MGDLEFGGGGGGGEGFFLGDAGTSAKLDLTHYSRAGVLSFLEEEWFNFQEEREKWERERTMLLKHIAKLEGERLSFESTQYDLLRRIKMLEYALKAERAKYSKEQTTTTTTTTAAVASPLPEEDLPVEKRLQRPQRKKGILEKYLQEYESRTQQLLLSVSSFSNNTTTSLSSSYPISTQPNHSNTNSYTNRFELVPAAAESGDKDSSAELLKHSQALHFGAKRSADRISDGDKGKEQATTENQPSTNNNSIGESFEEKIERIRQQRRKEEKEREQQKQMMGTARKTKLQQVVGNSRENGDDDDSSESSSDDDDDSNSRNDAKEKKEIKHKEKSNSGGGKTSQILRSRLSLLGEAKQLLQQQPQKQHSQESPASSAPSNAPKQLSPKGGNEQLASSGSSRVPTPTTSATASPSSTLDGKKPTSGMRSSLGGLDELDVQLREEVPNELLVPAGDRKTWQPVFTLRHHLDVVRSVSFHSELPILLSGSDDCTVKLWNWRVAGTVGYSKPITTDVEPAVTLRGHTAAVYSVLLASEYERCFSAGADCTVRVWELPNPNEQDPYAERGKGIIYDVACYPGHKDAIWSIALHSSRPILASASADATVKLWDFASSTVAKDAERITLSHATSEIAIPTCVCFVPTDVQNVLAGFTTADAYLFDIETGAPVTHLTPNDEPRPDCGSQINQIVAHPTLPLAISAHEDQTVKYWDLRTGKCTHSMIAHKDVVSALAIDPSGTFLLTAGHGCSLRFWEVLSKNCIQELNAHRQKHDEAIYSVAFHPTQDLIASGGADSTIKVFQ
ncbi:Striatin-4 [Balamuthia mandrillaris]